MCAYNDVKTVFEEDGIKLENSWSNSRYGYDTSGWEDDDDYAMTRYY